jgi:hypothetical protein
MSIWSAHSSSGYSGCHVPALSGDVFMQILHEQSREIIDDRSDQKYDFSEILRSRFKDMKILQQNSYTRIMTRRNSGSLTGRVDQLDFIIGLWSSIDSVKITRPFHGDILAKFDGLQKLGAA